MIGTKERLTPRHHRIGVHSPHCHQSAGGATGRLGHSELGRPSRAARSSPLCGFRFTFIRVIRGQENGRPANHANRCEYREHRRDNRSTTNLLRLCAYQNRWWKITANIVAVSRPPENASLLQETPPFCRQRAHSVGNALRGVPEMSTVVPTETDTERGAAWTAGSARSPIPTATRPLWWCPPTCPMQTRCGPHPLVVAEHRVVCFVNRTDGIRHR